MTGRLGPVTHGLVTGRKKGIPFGRHNQPFRRFRDEVHADLDLRAQWFAFRDDALAQHARDWLEALGIEVELLRRQK